MLIPWQIRFLKIEWDNANTWNLVDILNDLYFNTNLEYEIPQ